MVIDTPHVTLQTFGYPETVVNEYDHWVVLVRPAQVTLGSLVVVHKSDATSYADLCAESFAEFEKVVKDIEVTLGREIYFEKMNYLMLMMVDPHVHYHVIPRYSDARNFAGRDYADTGWPALPDLASAYALTDEERDTLVVQLQAKWGT